MSEFNKENNYSILNIMKYSKLVNIYEKLEITPSKLEKTNIISEFLSKTPKNSLETVLMLLTGQVFPEWNELELGVGPSLIYDTISFVTGFKSSEIKKFVAKEGDIGNVTEKILNKNIQPVLLKNELTIKQVYTSFEKIAKTFGPGSQTKKIKYLAELLSNASPKEAKYILRTILGELRIGVAEGLVRNAIAKSFNIDVNLIERAIMYTNNIGVVGRTAKEGIDEIKKIKMKLFIPVKPMLAITSPSISNSLNESEKVALEIKYDGARVQIHKKGNEIKIYSRKLENITKALPDVVKIIKEVITVDEVIIDGETVAINKKNGRPKPFQEVIKRFRRKHNIDDMVKKIPFETYIFDILYIKGNNIIDMEFKNRRKILEEIIKPIEGKLRLAEQVITSDLNESEEFYNYSLNKGHEGIMVKNMKASYMLGSRGGNMLKIKPIMETLDLAIIGATWGAGKRSGLFGSYSLGIKNEENKIIPIGNVGTGLTETQLKSLTSRLKPYIKYEKGQQVILKPIIVVEVAYQDIQKSSNHKAGYALRFPRVVNIRDDKNINDIDTIERLISLFNLMKK